MSYYGDKKRFFIEIENIIKKNKKVKVSDLYFFAMKTHGFGVKAVDNVINLMIEKGVILKDLQENTIEYTL